ncbi:hypothetical protein C8Q70DRAFT_1054590 [Cubamyces menziesii]|nr:hypothetical protein C8Q70DRAFT_1054590 [Cubamyces menziesii]
MAADPYEDTIGNRDYRSESSGGSGDGVATAGWNGHPTNTLSLTPSLSTIQGVSSKQASPITSQDGENVLPAFPGEGNTQASVLVIPSTVPTKRRLCGADDSAEGYLFRSHRAKTLLCDQAPDDDEACDDSASDSGSDDDYGHDHYHDDQSATKSSLAVPPLIVNQVGTVQT